MSLSRTYTLDYSVTGDYIGANNAGTGAVKKLDTDLSTAYTHLTNLQKNYSSGTAPSSPVEGQNWWDADNHIPYKYNGSAWIPIGINQSPVVTKTDNYAVTVNDFGKTLVMNSANTKTFTLPSVGSSNDGATITFVKQGAGETRIDPSDSDKVADGGAGDYIYNNTAAETYATLTLRYIHAIVTWVIIGGFGTWVTTD